MLPRPGRRRRKARKVGLSSIPGTQCWPGQGCTLLFIHSLPVHSLTRSAPTCWGNVGNSRDKELGAKATSSNFEFLKLF